MAFDLPTLMGRDPDHDLSLGEVGKCGVSIASLADMERLFDGISLADITTSMTINSPASMIFAMYLVVAEKQGADWQRLSGTIQNDILKEFIAQKEYIYPPRPSMRLITDVFAFCATEVPRWNTISVSGYHIREAGATALQELAFTLRDGLEYVQDRESTPASTWTRLCRASLLFQCPQRFFEEIPNTGRPARSGPGPARAVWCPRRARVAIRFHTQTAGVSLTAQQPYNNVVRTAIPGAGRPYSEGPYSLHTNSLDEAWALRPPSRGHHRAAHAANYCRTGAARATLRRSARRRFSASSVDLLTSCSKSSAVLGTTFRKNRPHGRDVGAIERGYPQRKSRKTLIGTRGGGRERKIIVGVNDFVDEEKPLRCSTLTKSRRRAACQTRCPADGPHEAESQRATNGSRGPGHRERHALLFEAARAYATVGEICDALREVCGKYEETPIHLALT